MNRGIPACSLLLAGMLTFSGTHAGPRGHAGLEASSHPDWNRDKAAHLLRRAGFGGPPEQIDHLVRLGRDRSVDLLVDLERTPPIDPSYPIETFVDRPPPGTFAGIGREDRRIVLGAPTGRRARSPGVWRPRSW